MYTPETSVAEGNLAMAIQLKGASGGHSGMDIHKGLANANKLMNRVLLEALDSVDLRVSSIRGGGLRNAIPRESTSVVVLAAQDLAAFEESLQHSAQLLGEEYALTDPDLVLA